MKRHDPYKRILSEQRLDSQRHYGSYTKEAKQSKINLVFTEKPHYQEVKK